MLNCDHSESAATLEAESGYSMEAPEVSDFRQYVLDGLWGKAEAALMRLAVSDEGLLVNLSTFLMQPVHLISHPGCQIPDKPAEIS
jgi:WD repeat-containing protein 26